MTSVVLYEQIECAPYIRPDPGNPGQYLCAPSPPWMYVDPNTHRWALASEPHGWDDCSSQALGEMQTRGEFRCLWVYAADGIDINGDGTIADFDGVDGDGDGRYDRPGERPDGQTDFYETAASVDVDVNDDGFFADFDVDVNGDGFFADFDFDFDNNGRIDPSERGAGVEIGAGREIRVGREIGVAIDFDGDGESDGFKDANGITRIAVMSVGRSC